MNAEVFAKGLEKCRLLTNLLGHNVENLDDIGDNRNLFFKLESKSGLYHVVLTTPKTSSEKLTLTVVEMQQLSDIEKTDSKQEISCLKWTKYNGRRKICVKLQTDTDKLNIVVYRYRNKL